MATRKKTRPKLTRSKAIREFCLECMNFQLKLINKCEDEPCPLWPFRTGVGTEKTDVLLRRQEPK